MGKIEIAEFIACDDSVTDSRRKKDRIKSALNVKTEKDRKTLNLHFLCVGSKKQLSLSCDVKSASFFPYTKMDRYMLVNLDFERLYSLSRAFYILWEIEDGKNRNDRHAKRFNKPKSPLYYYRRAHTQGV